MKNYGRSTKLLSAPKNIPDLHFNVSDTKEKVDSLEKTEVKEIMNVNTEESMTAPQNSKFREHSRNLLESVAGEAPELISEQRSVKQALDLELHSNASEYREHSQNSQNSGKPTYVEMPRKLMKRTISRDTHLQHSKSREHSQNSWIKQLGMVEVTASAEDTKRTVASSNFSKHSQNSLSKGEDQDSVTSSSDVLPEITVNEITS